MCGIAGIVDLTDERPVPQKSLRDMAQALFHRGPDEDGFFDRGNPGLASRRLSIVGLMDGRQPISNEDGSIHVVYNGELFDYPEKRTQLEAQGHIFKTHCDTEIIPHLWEQYGERMFDHLRGQFALALWDERRRCLILARDRFGICPLFWSRQGDWFLFASEVKALLASGFVAPRPDRKGINQVFTFFALPGPATCFEGVRLLLPGRYLKLQFGNRGQAANLSQHIYFDIDFPDAGDEDPGRDAKKVIDGFEEVFRSAVELRLRADVPVVSYLSGGVDSSIVVAMACQVRKPAIPTFTIQIRDPKFDERREAEVVAGHVGADPVVVPFGNDDVLSHYPSLIRAAECPVVDTSCAALLRLAAKVNELGYKVALTGEGADEWLAGYPWYKVDRLLGFFDLLPGLKGSQQVRRLFLKVTRAPQFPWHFVRRVQDAVGGHNAWLDIYGLMSMSKLRFYSPSMLELALEHLPYHDLEFDPARLRRWHPLNRALYLGARVMLPGLLLSCKGDRVAMHSSVETRYPFLDERVYAYLARLHPRWKMRGFCDKYILRRMSERWLPKSIAWRRKAMFRAPLDSFHLDPLPVFVEQLLSDESLRKTGYFNADNVRFWRERYRHMRAGSPQRTSVEMGLVGVVATQLWHHIFIDSTLADLPAGRIARPTSRHMGKAPAAQ
ncbi:MAG: asparagine synthase (glutamine-hydrolyzing) [Gemmatales bacterium]|nr:MAG: asparagine synthase (glutamine-hydrolyzing) [Gemmatales bacterium]